MLKPQHIIKFKLDPARYQQYCTMPAPSYANKAITNQFAAIGNIVISGLLGVSPDVFGMQLDAARSFGASYLVEDKRHNMIGISAVTSLIKDSNVIGKNVVLTRDLSIRSDALKKHFIIGVFVQGSTHDGLLDNVDAVNVAGWLTSSEIAAVKMATLPPTFKSKINIDVVPCNRLNPIDILGETLRLATTY